jgi:hypothetical protein
VQLFPMPKIGCVREDGRVYNGKNLSFKCGEYWATMDAFLKHRGNDWYEKRSIMDNNVKARLMEKEASAKRAKEAIAIREERQKLRSLKPKRKPRRTFLTDKERQDAKKQWEKERKSTDAYKLSQQKHREIRLIKSKERKKLRDEIRLKKEEEMKMVVDKRLAEKAKKKEETALAKFLRPKRVLLTDEQRKENQRQGKRNYKHVRRARINNCEVKATPKIVEEARKNAGDRCYYCGKKCKLTLDHFDSLSKGGAHCVSNFVFACFSCNSRKRDLDPFEFMESNLAISF